MGMAASQARYLGLTARKTNVEYEGQQINQQRTALANQSANTFNELLALEVPTAPSTQDYTSIEYTYKDGSYAETIETMSALTDDPEFNYVVKHFHYADIYTGIESKKTNPQVVESDRSIDTPIPRADITQTGADYSINGHPVTIYDPNSGVQSNIYNKLKQDYPSLQADDMMTYTDDNGLIHFMSKTELDAGGDVTDYSVASGVPTYVGNCELNKYDETDSDLKAAYEQIIKDYPNSTFAASAKDDIYYWKQNGQFYFACASDLTNSAISAPDPEHPTEHQDKLLFYEAKSMSKKIEKTEKAFIDFDDSGRAQSIRYEDSDAVYSLITNTVTDENAYEDAMNQYTYDMQVYEKAIADINAKTERIQEEDRTLELRLKQLDTEQEALQTEMEAVKKVIDKNIENTFKTFE